MHCIALYVVYDTVAEVMGINTQVTFFSLKFSLRSSRNVPELRARKVLV